MRAGRTCVLASLFVAMIMIVPVAAFAGPPSAKGEKEWTLMMYWDADNSLEFCTEFAMSAWEEALPTNERVNIVALIDILSEQGTWIYEIAKGKRRLVDTWTEANTSDPAVLERFVLYCMDRFPAKKTMLVLQDHGYGWRGVCQDETNGNTLMPIDGLAGALMDAKARAKGKGVDIIAFDACHMATLEVAYELRGVASYMLGSQSMVPYDGLPYEMFVSELWSRPEMSPIELVTAVVYDYVEYYSSKWDYEHIMTYSQDFATIAALDLGKTAALGSAFAEFTELLCPLIPGNRGAVERARGTAQVTQWANSAGYEWMPDVHAFVTGMKGVDGRLDASISAWEEAFDAAVVAQANSRKMGDEVHGLNFWFPPSLSQYNSQSWIWARQFVYHASGLDLVADSAWVDCLMAYYASG